MYIDNHLTVIEDAVRLLVLASSQTNPSLLRHSFPHKASKNEGIPILAEVDDNLQRLERISEMLVQIKTQLIYWKGHTNGARPIGALPAEVISCIFSHVHDDATSRDRPRAVVRLSHVNSTWRGICLVQSMLWADIDGEWGHARQSVWLERSKQQPLRIFAETNRVNIPLLLAKAINRIDTITIRAISGDWEGDLFAEAVALGRLHALRRINLENRWDRRLAESWILNSPNLQYVTLHRVWFPSLDVEEFPSLPWTYLDISGYGNHARWYVKLFRACARLCALAVHNNAFISDRGIMNVEELQLDRMLPSTPVLFSQLKELYVETRQEEDRIIRLLSRFTLAPALTVLRIVIRENHQGCPDPETSHWTALVDILCLLDHSPLVETVEIFGHPAYTSIVFRALAHHRHSLFNLRRLGVDCKLGFEETWYTIIGLLATWAVPVGAATDVIEELTLFDAPIEWHERTMPYVGLLRFTTIARPPIHLFRSAYD